MAKRKRLRLYVVTEHDEYPSGYDVAVGEVVAAYSPTEALERSPIGHSVKYPATVRFIGYAARGVQDGEQLLEDFCNG